MPLICIDQRGATENKTLHHEATKVIVLSDAELKILNKRRDQWGSFGRKSLVSRYTLKDGLGIYLRHKERYDGQVRRTEEASGNTIYWVGTWNIWVEKDGDLNGVVKKANGDEDK